jgi:hypothetical protein
VHSDTSVTGAGGGTNGVHFVTIPRQLPPITNDGVVDIFVDMAHTCRTNLIYNIGSVSHSLRNSAKGWFMGHIFLCKSSIEGG